MDNIVILSGNSNEKLATDISNSLNVIINPELPKQFNNTEIQTKISLDIRGKNVYIIQSGCQNKEKNLSINDILLELLILVDACRRSMANKISIIMPLYPYSRCDKKDEPRAPIGAKLVANLLEAVKIDRLVSFDLHAAQIQGFLDTPFDNLYSAILVIEKLNNSLFSSLTLDERQNKYVVVSPDAGAAKRTLSLAKSMKLNTIIMHKQRDYSKPGEIEKTLIISESESAYKNKTAIICDDIADTCGTLISAINELVKVGIKDVICVITHGVFSKNALDKINDCSYITKFYVSDSIPQENNCKKCSKLEVFSVAPLLSQVIERIENGGHISSLFVY
jgi:ribose-phosphate pyrophosphokinase